MERRELLKYLSFTPLIGALPLAGVAGQGAGSTGTGVDGSEPVGGPVSRSTSSDGSVKRDLFKELGIRTFINAAGTYTAMTGSLMHDFVVDTIADASHEFCMLDEVQDKAGEKIASLVHAEA